MIEQRKKELGNILETLVEGLDLSPSQYEDAEKKYKAVGEFLGKPGSLLARYNPSIYPQGSIRLGTVVKPFGRDEFDVDLVCELLVLSQEAPNTVKKWVGDRFREKEAYRRILEELNRCWLLNYKGQFHMDLLPSIPDRLRRNGCILVPDRKLRAWKESNPKGYAKWFENRMIAVRKQLRAMIAAKAEIQPLPDENKIKTPLQRSVQILKRHRDISFQDDKDNAPISIVITTLAAKAYDDTPDLYDALIHIIQEMPRHVDIEDGAPAVLNPTNPAENFAEKWKEYPERYKAFTKWLIDLRIQLDQLLQMRGHDKIAKGLSPLFGKQRIESTMAEHARRFDESRRMGTIRVSIGSGILGSTGALIPRNTFYGD